MSWPRTSWMLQFPMNRYHIRYVKPIYVLVCNKCCKNLAFDPVSVCRLYVLYISGVPACILFYCWIIPLAVILLADTLPGAILWCYMLSLSYPTMLLWKCFGLLDAISQFTRPQGLQWLLRICWINILMYQHSDYTHCDRTSEAFCEPWVEDGTF